MIGIIAAVAARVKSRHANEEVEAYLIGTQIHRIRENPESLQAFIDNSRLPMVTALWRTLATDPNASAFTQVKWPSQASE